jgi:hypothetical protein
VEWRGAEGAVAQLGVAEPDARRDAMEFAVPKEMPVAWWWSTSRAARVDRRQGLFAPAGTK